MIDLKDAARPQLLEGVRILTCSLFAAPVLADRKSKPFDV